MYFMLYIASTLTVQIVIYQSRHDNISDKYNHERDQIYDKIFMEMSACNLLLKY
jgi:hypothetical protein